MVRKPTPINAYAAITSGVAVPNQPAKSSAGDAPLSCVVTYQNVRKSTMKVFGFALTIPSAVAVAQRNITPTRSATAEDGRAAIARPTGNPTTATAMKSVLRNFHRTNRVRSEGAAKMRAIVAARFSRQATSAMARAQAANAIGNTPVKIACELAVIAAIPTAIIATISSGNAPMVVS